MNLVPVPRYEYACLMHFLGRVRDTPVLASGGVVYAERLGECCYLDPMVFEVVVGRAPVLLTAALAFALAGATSGQHVTD